jgi:tetratricopeptide (TPR) repeat protein
MTWKAAICYQRDQWDDGDAWVNRAYAIRKDLPDLLELLSRVLNAKGMDASDNADDLRSPKSWTDYGPIWDTVWTHYPTQGELDRADALEQSADRMWQAAQDDLAKAARLRGNTGDGHYFNGLLQFRKGNVDGAISELLVAATMDFSRRNSDALVDVLLKANRKDDAVNQRFKFVLSRQTTAITLLDAAWENIQKGIDDKGQELLTDSMPIDPCDSRIEAYAASIATAEKKPEQALHWYNIALALEEARANLNGESLWHGDEPLKGEQVALTLMCDLRAGARAGQLGRHDDQVAYLDRNVQLGKRVQGDELTTPAYRTLLPNPNELLLRKAKSAGSLLAWSLVYHAYGLCAQHKLDQAVAECRFVWALPHDPTLFAVQRRAIALPRCGRSGRRTWPPSAG